MENYRALYHIYDHRRFEALARLDQLLYDCGSPRRFPRSCEFVESASRSFAVQIQMSVDMWNAQEQLFRAVGGTVAIVRMARGTPEDKEFIRYRLDHARTEEEP